MSVVVWILLSALAVLLLAMLTILASPVRFLFVLRTAPDFRMTVGVRLLGNWAPTIPLLDSARPRPPRKPATKHARTTSRKPGPGRRRRASRIPRAVASTPRLVSDLLRPVHVERLRVDGTLGLDNPADTGHLFGLFAAARYALPTSDAISVALQPDFTGPRLSGSLEARVRFVPLAFVPPGIRFARHVFGPRP